MTDILRDLAGRIRSETQNVEHAAQLAGRRWRKALLDEDYLGSVALDLQSCYQGIERCFELVARVVDGSAPGGDQWHQALLAQMGSELPGVRPAILSPHTQGLLDQLRRFRHVTRHVYGFNLEVTKVAALMEVLPQAVQRATQELRAFADFLDGAEARWHEDDDR